jgi:hypothetical protein
MIKLRVLRGVIGRVCIIAAGIAVADWLTHLH